MLGLVGGFLVGHLLWQMFVSSDDARVTSETAGARFFSHSPSL